MKLKEALALLGEPPAGIQSQLEAAFEGWHSPDRGESSSLKTARANVKAAADAQHGCGSDAAWWAYEGERSYWQAVVHILEAAKLVGEENLPDVAGPDPKYKLVMDRGYAIEQFAKALLEQAQRVHKG